MSRLKNADKAPTERRPYRYRPPAITPETVQTIPNLTRNKKRERRECPGFFHYRLSHLIFEFLTIEHSSGPPGDSACDNLPDTVLQARCIRGALQDAPVKLTG